MRLRLPSPAMAVACVALGVSLGGTGWAAIKLPANSVGSKQLRKGAVGERALADRAVTARKLRPGSVEARHLAGGAVGTPALALNAVTSTRIADGSVESEDVRAGALRGDRLAADSVGGAQVDESSLGRVPDSTALGGLPASGYQTALGFAVRVKADDPSTGVGPVEGLAIARCQEGERAVGGGGLWAGTATPKATITASVPVRPVSADDSFVLPAGEGETPTGWLAKGFKDPAGGNSGSATLTAYVICAR